MHVYLNFLKKSLPKNYKNMTVFKLAFIGNFFSYRKKILKTLENNKNNKNNKNNQINLRDKTYFKISNFYFNKSNKKNDLKILKFYKKFEVNLSLKIKYNRNLKKLSNVETCTDTYIFLGLLIKKCRLLNNIQKINCIVKIVDKILFNKLKHQISNNQYLIGLIKFENRMIRKLLNEN